jgi:glutamate formiminotransferase/formiminotetrahydrofolate cyclodeaminase
MGEEISVPGTLKSVKAIGWYIEEYGIAQISMNLTNISVTPVHIAFDEVCRKADARGVRVTGSELVGLIPLKSLLDAGRHFLAKQERSSGVSDAELIKIAVRSMGLNDIHHFNPDEKIIEYVMAKDDNKKRLVTMSLYEFMNETASESPAPGGGSISAYMGSLGAALGTMVANLSSHKKGWDDRWKEFSDWAEKGKALQNELLQLVEEDTNAFNRIMEAFGLPKKTDEEKELRKAAIQEATKNAILIPFQVMQTAYSGFELIEKMVETGNPNSITDAGVGAIALSACIKGAFLNVRINASGLLDKEFAAGIIRNGEEIELKTVTKEEKILTIIRQKIK